MKQKRLGNIAFSSTYWIIWKPTTRTKHLYLQILKLCYADFKIFSKFCWYPDAKGTVKMDSKTWKVYVFQVTTVEMLLKPEMAGNCIIYIIIIGQKQALWRNKWSLSFPHYMKRADTKKRPLKNVSPTSPVFICHQKQK